MNYSVVQSEEAPAPRFGSDRAHPGIGELVSDLSGMGPPLSYGIDWSPQVILEATRIPFYDISQSSLARATYSASAVYCFCREGDLKAYLASTMISAVFYPFRIRMAPIHRPRGDRRLVWPGRNLCFELIRGARERRRFLSLCYMLF